MSGTDLIVAAPWIIFAVVLATIFIFLLRARRASRPDRHQPADGPPPKEEKRCPPQNNETPPP